MADDWWFHVANLSGLRGNCIADTRAGVILGMSEAHLYRIAGRGLERVRSYWLCRDRRIGDAPGRLDPPLNRRRKRGGHQSKRNE
jgi:hypothetical protein